MAFDAEINAVTGDMRIPTRLITGADLVVQRARVRLGTFFAEYILDQFVGLPFLEWQQQKPPDLAAIGAVIFAEMSETPGVVRVVDFAVTFDNSSRTLRAAGNVVIEDADDADDATFAFVTLIAPGNSTPAVVMFHRSGFIAR